MGGNVFKDEHEVDRIPRKYYDQLCCDLQDELIMYCPDSLLLKIVPSYYNKESHGDIDIVYSCGVTSENLDKILKDYFDCEPDEISRNSNVTSFLYTWVAPNNEDRFNVQVDMIYHPREIFECAVDYYSFNDLGNLVGRIAHKMGLKYGHDGLKYIHNDGDQRVFELVLSRDTAEIHKFLGFEPISTKKLFRDHPATLEDIFKYVVSNPHFTPDIYLLDNRNHTSRVRDAKRKTYMEFLKYCETLGPVEPIVLPTKYVSQQRAIQHFGQWEEYLFQREIHIENKVIKTKLNGDLIMELSGLKGKELGALVQKVKSHFTRDMLLVIKPETIRQIVVEIIQHQK